KTKIMEENRNINQGKERINLISGGDNVGGNKIINYKRMGGGENLPKSNKFSRIRYLTSIIVILSLIGLIVYLILNVQVFRKFSKEKSL
ncbi:MAG: hypothetical protein ACPG19_15830, partial [Saprospiraceae bacterium]